MHVTCMLHVRYILLCYMHVAGDIEPIIINVVAGSVDVCIGFLCME